MTDLTDLNCTSLTIGGQDIPAPTVEILTGAADPISIKHGVVVLNRVGSKVDATLADPTATTDDFKRLTIVAMQAQGDTVTSATSFGGGGAGEDVATFSGVVGDALSLIAYQGRWYITGTHQVVIA